MFLLVECFNVEKLSESVRLGCFMISDCWFVLRIFKRLNSRVFVCLLCSGACDSIIFMFLGVALVRDDHFWQTGFVLWSAFLCLAVRFMGMNPLLNATMNAAYF